MVGKQLLDPFIRVRWDTRQNIRKICHGIHAVLLAGFNQAIDNGCRLSSPHASHKQVILSAKNYSFYAPLRAVVVNFKAPILNVHSEGLPIIQRIENRLTQQAFWQNLGLMLDKPLMDPIQNRL